MIARRGPLIAGIASGVIALILIVFLILPKMHQVTSTKADLQDAQDNEITLQATLNALQDAQANAPQTQSEIAALDAQVPPVPDLPSLFTLLQSAADRSAVDFFQFSPGAPTVAVSGDYSTIPSQITVTGSYFALDEFLYNLETLPRAAKVTNMSISPGGAEGTTTTSSSLSMQLSVEFYTTSTSAGPGAIPVFGESPTPTPTPTATPTPTPGA